MTPQGPLQLVWRPFQFRLPQALVTAHGAMAQQRGWLLKLSDPAGRLGWGEVTPLAADWPACGAAIAELGETLEQGPLETQLPLLPGPLAFGLGLALAELAGLGSAAQGGWLPAPASAWLLPAGPGALAALGRALAVAGPHITLKWKVATEPEASERAVLEALLALLPDTGRLRLDANGGWDRACAHRWAERLRQEPRLAWLEQPLAPGDHEGLLQLAALLPVALDESLRDPAGLPPHWPGWRVHRPALGGDPRPLLRAFGAGEPRAMVSTALGTGISQRLLAHLAALQAAGPTPCAPGLAPGWGARGDLASADPGRVWAAALATAPLGASSTSRLS